MTSRPRIPESIQTLGEAVRFLREKRGLTLRALASKVKVSAPFLTDIEHNRRNTEKLAELAEALGVDEEDLRRFDGRLPTDVKNWISANPEIIGLLEDMRTSGSTPAELRATFKRRR